MEGETEKTKARRDRHVKQRRRMDRRCHVMRDEIERLYEVMHRRETQHESEVVTLRAEILAVGMRGVDALQKQAAVIPGFESAQARLRHGFLSRLWFGLGLAWRGRFA